MENVHNKRLLFFASIFAFAVLIDGLKFMWLGKPTVVNWESFVHPAWVIGAVVMLFLSSYFDPIRRLSFLVYLTIFVLSYVNIYLLFTEVLTYFCMIFNLVLTSVCFFSRQDH